MGYRLPPTPSFDFPAMGHMQMTSTQPQGMFTRNLISSITCSVFCLTDPDSWVGI
jgi:hypothetical protein